MLKCNLKACLRGNLSEERAGKFRSDLWDGCTNCVFQNTSRTSPQRMRGCNKLHCNNTYTSMQTAQSRSTRQHTATHCNILQYTAATHTLPYGTSRMFWQHRVVAYGVVKISRILKIICFSCKRAL